MVAETQIPTLAKIKNEASETDARALLYIAVCEVCDFFNVGKNMNDTQVAYTVNLILESFWHLKPTEIKYCFRRAMMREKIFDRLDGNIIIGWLRDYNDERTEEAIKLSHNREYDEAHSYTESPNAITKEEYVARLKERAAAGDKDAKEKLALNDELERINAPGKEDAEAKKREFRLWRYEYLKNKQKG